MEAYSFVCPLPWMVLPPDVILSEGGYERSALGLEGWQNGLRLKAVRAASKDDLWKPVYGGKNRIRDRYRALFFQAFMKNAGSNESVQIEVRAYNEGSLSVGSFFPVDLPGTTKSRSVRT